MGSTPIVGSSRKTVSVKDFKAMKALEEFAVVLGCFASHRVLESGRRRVAKRSASRIMPESKVYILGAGCSKDCGYPLGSHMKADL